MNKCAQVRAILVDGPATSMEIAAETGWGDRESQIAIAMLISKGQAKVTGKIRLADKQLQHGHRRYRHLYELTPQGRYLQKSDAPYTCPHCGNPCDELFTVDDSDASVGYRDELEVCAKCASERKLNFEGRS